MKIYKELSRIQQGLKAPKGLYNSFGKYYYRNAEGILEAVKPMLNGLALIINDEPVMVGDRFYIKATVTLTDGEESVSAVAYAREDAEKRGMDGCQLTGACSSYARKYALNALLMIDDSKDSDDDSLSPKNPANKEEEKPKSKEEKKPPKETAPAQVEKTDRVPDIPKKPEDKPKKPEPTPAQVYLLKAMKELRAERGISIKENNTLFTAQFNALKENKLAPDKALEEYTLDEAEAMIDAMYKRFSPTGTELKK